MLEGILHPHFTRKISGNTQMAHSIFLYSYPAGEREAYKTIWEFQAEYRINLTSNESRRAFWVCPPF